MTDPIYESRTRASAMPIEPKRGPAPGAIIGDAVADLGQTMVRVEQVDRQRERASMAADRSVAFAGMQADIAAEDGRLRREAPASEYEQRIGDYVERRTRNYIDTLSDPEIRNDFLPDVARLRGNVMAQASTYAIEQRGAKLVADADQARDLGANNLRTSVNPLADRSIQIDQARKRAESFVGIVPADVAAKIYRADVEAFTGAALEAMPAEERKARLEKGEFNADLGKEQLQRLIDRADSDINAAASQARTLANLGKAEARETIDGLTRSAADGVPVPDADLDKAQAVAQQYGLDAKVYDIGKLRVQNRANRETAAWTPQQFSATINQLEERIAKAGDRPSPDDVVLRDHMMTLRSRRETMLGQHPDQFLATIGVQESPIDWSDPTTTTPERLAARSRTRRALSQEAGTPLRLLNDAEAQPLIDMIGSDSGAQRLEAAKRVALWGRDAPAILQQVAAGDEGFRIATRLGSLPDGGQTMRDALNGKDALKANANLIKPEAGQPKLDELFAKNTATALRGISPSYAAGVMDTATNIYAARMQRAGQSAWNPHVFLGAVQSALGGLSVNGRWTGGITEYRDSTVLLPVGMTSDDFSRRIARASGAQWGAAGNGLPVFTSGRTAYTAELRGWLPVAVGDGVYALRQGNTYMQRKGGGRYQFDVRKLPAGN